MPDNELKAVAITETGRGNTGHRMHLAFSAIPRVEMVAISDPDEAGRAASQAECGAPRVYADHREMLDKERPDIVVVARAHYDDDRVQEALDAIDAGARGMFIEKTIAAWPHQARLIQRKAAENGVTTVLAHRSREHPVMQEVRRRGQAGEWGPLTRIRAMDKGDHRVGVYEAMIHTPHIFDAMLYLTGEAPTSCWGSVMRQGRPATREDARGVTFDGAGPMAGDRVSAHYQFPSGVIGTFESMPVGDGSYGNHRLGVDFYFQNAVITARNQPFGEFHLFPRGDLFPTEPGVEWQHLQADDWTPFGHASSDRSNQVLCEDLVRMVDGGAPNEESSTIDVAAIGVEMLCGAYWSHLEGRRVELPLSDLSNPWADED